ncbi:MAG: dephospho-CoA kinase [Pseudomonadota bacterium]
MTKPLDRPLRIGLTGSIGMGKSTVASMFRDAGVPVFDADAEVRASQGPDGELVPAIETAFPGSTDSSGVDRDKLGNLVFGDAKNLAQLEAIVHPFVAQKRVDFLSANASAKMLAFDIPLLFERGGNEAVDCVVVVSAPFEIQRDRVLTRPGMTQEKFDHILGLQTPDARKREQADYVIDTGAPLASTRLQVADLIEALSDRQTLT